MLAVSKRNSSYCPSALGLSVSSVLYHDMHAEDPDRECNLIIVNRYMPPYITNKQFPPRKRPCRTASIASPSTDVAGNAMIDFPMS